MRALPAVLVDSAIWAGWGTAVGWAASRIDPPRLAPPRAWERRAYERLGVRRWKDRLPEAGAIFGGASKRSVGGRSSEALARFEAESRRAELVHRVVPLALLVFPLWSPWYVTAVMALYAAAANGPCLVAIRYNRARLAKLVPCR